MSTQEIDTAPAMALELDQLANRCQDPGDAARMKIAAEMINRLYALLMTEAAEPDALEQTP